MRLQTTCLTLGILFFFHQGFILAQSKHADKWGNVSAKDLSLQAYPEEPDARAAVLQDVGDIAVVRANGKFQVEYLRHRRIKIFDPAALNEGNLFIPYRADKNLEDISGLKIMVYAPDGEKWKVDGENVFTVKLSEKWSAKKVFVPNLSKGCVIEYQYRLVSQNFLTLYDWYFQEDIPVRWSEVTLSVPRQLQYAYLTKNNQPFDLNEVVEKSQSMDGTTLPVKVSSFGMANLPSLKDEPYVVNVNDHRVHIGFQLQAIYEPGLVDEQIMSTWDKLAGELMKNDGLGGAFLKEGHCKLLWAAFKGQIQPGDPVERVAEKALRFVSGNITWDGQFDLLADHDPDECFRLKKGNSADINLAVVALLRQAGLKAAPVLTSTRANGTMFPLYPFVDQFNHVLASVREGQKIWVIDATNPHHALNETQPECYNYKGWLVDETEQRWIDLPVLDAIRTFHGELKLDESGSLSGRYECILSGAFASAWRATLESTTPSAVVKSQFGRKGSQGKIDSVVIDQTDVYVKPLIAAFTLEWPQYAMRNGNLMYLNPTLDFVFTENPFQATTRKLPVDFPFPIRAEHVVNIAIPTGWTVEELPEPINLNLGNNSGKLVYSCQKEGEDRLLVILRMSLKQLRFEPEDYHHIKKYFDYLTEKCDAQVVLKKL